MNPEFVPYELAVALKKQGFDKPCFAVYEDKRWQLVEVRNSMSYDLCVETDTFSAPTLSQALRWFREVHGLHHEILLDKTTQPKYCFEINRYMHFGNYELVKNPDWCLYRTPEEAQLDCLVMLIEIVKNANEKHI